MRAVGALLLLAACQQEPVESTGAAANAGPCDAAKVQDLIGRPVDQVQADAQRRSGARSVRVYRSNSPVTMDYRPDRLNVETDEKGAIVKLSCG